MQQPSSVSNVRHDPVVRQQQRHSGRSSERKPHRRTGESVSTASSSRDLRRSGHSAQSRRRVSPSKSRRDGAIRSSARSSSSSQSRKLADDIQPKEQSPAQGSPEKSVKQRPANGRLRSSQNQHHSKDRKHRGTEHCRKKSSRNVQSNNRPQSSENGRVKPAASHHQIQSALSDSLNDLSYEVDVPHVRTSRRRRKRDEASTDRSSSSRQPSLTDEQRAWSGVANILKDSSSILTSDVLPPDILSAMRSQHSSSHQESSHKQDDCSEHLPSLSDSFSSIETDIQTIATRAKNILIQEDNNHSTALRTFMSEMVKTLQGMNESERKNVIEELGNFSMPSLASIHSDFEKHETPQNLLDATSDDEENDQDEYDYYYGDQVDQSETNFAPLPSPSRPVHDIDDDDDAYGEEIHEDEYGYDSESDHNFGREISYSQASRRADGYEDNYFDESPNDTHIDKRFYDGEDSIDEEHYIFEDNEEPEDEDDGESFIPSVPRLSIGTESSDDAMEDPVSRGTSAQQQSKLKPGHLIRNLIPSGKTPESLAQFFKPEEKRVSPSKSPSKLMQLIVATTPNRRNSSRKYKETASPFRGFFKKKLNSNESSPTKRSRAEAQFYPDESQKEGSEGDGLLFALA